ncbi:MAG: lytic transglycosylase domain-containing protein [Proteobacteria bacterium]|nr:lytic transglycosylase domain-containing protein [Pseudomonadota bacterium]MBU1058251.1 lytic transglycosylase domain-containing protein [Pseudomonadota bacterium]
MNKRCLLAIIPCHSVTILTIVLLWLIATPCLLQAATVELPLFLRMQILQNTLEESLRLQADGKAVLYQKDPYTFLHITRPVFFINHGKIHFKCNATAKMGFEPIGILPSGIEWTGTIDLTLHFYVDEQWHLRYRITDSAIYDEDGSQAVVSNFVWHLSTQYLYPVLEDFSLDLSLPQQEIITLLRTCGFPEDAKTFEEALTTTQAGPLRIAANGIVMPLLLTLRDQPRKPKVVPAAQKPLTQEELEAFQQVFEPLDAFLVFVVKTTAADFVNYQQREQLFDLLISSRYQLLSILAGDIAVDAEDPLRNLFVDAWQQLKSIIESSEGQNGLMQEQLLRYMTFMNAGDALLLLDVAAPQLGMRITTNGLRQLARMLQPGSPEDPLRFDWQIDPGLRDLLNFLPDPEEKTSPIGRLILELFIETAHAAETIPGTPAEIGRRLDRWVPTPDELADFTPLVAELLRLIALEKVKKAGLDSTFSMLYQHLVPATALMESCWRQYIIDCDKIEYLRSPSGSVGMMQINPHVWRGFYSIERLKWDTVYNIQSGAEILMHYYKDYGLKVAKQYGKPEYAVRAAYSAYNAGPRAAQRFMKKSPSAREKKVDTRLWSYFQRIRAGGSVNLATCNVD